MRLAGTALIGTPLWGVVFIFSLSLGELHELTFQTRDGYQLKPKSGKVRHSKHAPTCSPLTDASFFIFLSWRRILALRQGGLFGSAPKPGTVNFKKRLYVSEAWLDALIQHMEEIIWKEIHLVSCLYMAWFSLLIHVPFDLKMLMPLNALAPLWLLFP